MVEEGRWTCFTFLSERCAPSSVRLLTFPDVRENRAVGWKVMIFFFPLSFNLIDCGGISGHHPSSQSDIKETMESIHYVFAETQVLSRHILRKKAVQKL